MEASPKAGASGEAQGRSQSDAPQRVLANRRNRDLADNRHPNLVLCQNSDSHGIPKRRPTALGPGANIDAKLLIYGLFQKSRVLAQDGVQSVRSRKLSRPPVKPSNNHRQEMPSWSYVSFTCKWVISRTLQLLRAAILRLENSPQWTI